MPNKINDTCCSKSLRLKPLIIIGMENSNVILIAIILDIKFGRCYNIICPKKDPIASSPFSPKWRKVKRPPRRLLNPKEPQIHVKMMLAILTISLSLNTIP
jgi:hypothetical protein